MRVITSIIQFLARIVAGRDTVTYELSGADEHQESDALHKTLVGLLARGNINEAENFLFKELNPANPRQMMVAIDFYQRLNDLDDEDLQTRDFSRKEIEEGLRDIARKAGIMTL